MSKLVIKDLPDSIELDRQAMASISGGARLSRVAPLPLARPTDRLIDYPPGVKRQAAGKRGDKP